VLRTLLRAKIHRCVVTEANLAYEGSLTLDADLLRAADMLPFERVEVVNVNTGARFDTYCIEGRAGSGEVCANGGAARLVQPGDLLIVMAYAQADDAEARRWRPRVVLVDARNRVRGRRLPRAGRKVPRR
jgi:aspartate 1-decarboxylase